MSSESILRLIIKKIFYYCRLDVSDIRFLLSVAATHSTVNVDGIY